MCEQFGPKFDSVIAECAIKTLFPKNIWQITLTFLIKNQKHFATPVENKEHLL